MKYSVLVRADPPVIKMLIEMGRLRWSQQADPLAIGKAMNQMLKDLLASGMELNDFIRNQKRQHARSTRPDDHV